MEVTYAPPQTADQMQSTQPDLTDEQRERARQVLMGEPPKPPENNTSQTVDQNTQDAPQSLTELEQQVQSPEPIDWESLSERARLEEGIEQLRLLGYPEADLQQMRQTLADAKVFFDQKQTADTAVTVPQREQQEKNKTAFSMRQVAGIGLFVLLDSTLNHGHGISSLLETFMSEQVVPGFMEKLGFDKELIESLNSRRFDLGRGLFQMDRPSLIRFLSNMSKTESYEFLESLDQQERQDLLHDGTFGNRHNLLAKDEVKKYLVDRLTEPQKQKLNIM